VIRAAAAALLAALASAAWLALFYATGATLRADFGINPPRPLTGFYRAERDPTTGLTFAWTGAEAGLRLPGLDRRTGWTLAVRGRSANPTASSHPALTFYVDGVHLHTHETSHEFQEVSVTVPARPERRGVTITMRSSSTFVPGPGDPRELGVMVDAIELTPDGLVLPAPDIFARAMLAGAALAAGVALLGVTAGAAIGGAVLLSAGQGAVLAFGFAPYTTFPQTALRLALVTAGILAVGAWLVRWRGRPLRNTARFALAFSAGAGFLELLVLLHPNMPIGDALFHAHRFQGVLAGNLYFTSVAPGGYAFPYAPGLYVTAWPFAGLVQREMGDVVLLRVITTVADVSAGLLLYFVTVRGWRDRLAGAVAVAMYHLIPLSFRIVTVGNLTNAFAQSLAIPALALMTVPASHSVSSRATAVLVVVLTVAFLSHTSTFAILSLCGVVTAFLFARHGGRALRSAATAVGLASCVAIVLAIALYYAHFIPTYQTELARLGTETATAAPDAGGRGTSQRLGDVPRLAHLYLGFPALVLAAGGALSRWRGESRDRLSLAVAGWVSTCAVFLLLGVLTPLDMRYYLAVIPSLALLAAAGTSWGWRAGDIPRLGVMVLLLWVVWIGVGTWWNTLE
jgi:putative effector of murein hydrolase LrgA (UPF0299 family)